MCLILSNVTEEQIATNELLQREGSQQMMGLNTGSDYVHHEAYMNMQCSVIGDEWPQ